MFNSMTRLFFFFALTLWPIGSDNPNFLSKDSKIKKSSLDLPANPEDFKLVRILLANGVKEMSVKSTSKVQILDRENRLLLSSESLKPAHIQSASEGIYIGSQIFRDLPIMIQTSGGSLVLNGRSYRNAVQVRKDEKGNLILINFVDIEDYLKGVLPWEANPKWHMEALKTQAVAARTYALFKMIENADQSFDLSKDVLSQVYGGKTSENSVTSEAVDATKGQILVYRGKIFPAYFHSTCAGATTNAETIWDIEPHPSLKGAACNFCKASKHYKWSGEFTSGDIASKLRKSGKSIGNISAIEVSKQDAFGRATQFTVIDQNGKYTFRANDFRLWLDPGKFKSTMITAIEKKGDGFYFQGRGWGHGAGLCQYGMKDLAELGYGYVEILKYYYAGSDIKQYWE